MRRAAISCLVVAVLTGRVEAQPGLTTPTPVAVKDPAQAKSVASAVTLGILPPLLVAVAPAVLSTTSGRSPGLMLTATF